MNIVVVRHGNGTYVSSLEPQLLAEPLQLILSVDTSAVYALFEVRRITEPAAASLAASRATTDELEALQEEMKRGIDAQGVDSALVEHDARLHLLIHQAAHNPLLLSLSASLAGLANKARQRTVKLPRNAPLTVSEHQAIVDAICARDEDAASRSMILHLTRVENDLRQHTGVVSTSAFDQSDENNDGDSGSE